MNQINTLLLGLLVLYLAYALFRPCPNTTEGFDPSAAPDVEIGTVRVRPAGRGANDVKFNFRGRFTRNPFIKLEAMNGEQDMFGKNIYSIAVKRVTTSGCELRVNRVDEGQFNAPLDKQFLIQYIAMEDPSKSST